MTTAKYNQTLYNTPRIVACLTVLLTGILLAATPIWAQTAGADYEPGIILVKFSDQVLPEIGPIISAGDIRDSLTVQLLNTAGFTTGRKLFEHFNPADTLSASTTGEPVILLDISRWYRLQVAATADVIHLADQLKSLPGILSAAPDYYLELDDIFPNDPSFSNQWGLYNALNPGNDIHAPQAWELNRGRSDVVVGVIDSGIDYNHDDLDPGDRSRVIQGYDFANNDSDPMDDAPGGNHGTPVAGVIGAITNNSLQVAGIMWDTKLMPLKIKKSSETGSKVSTSAAAEAADHARQNGAHILNMSFGRPECDNIFCAIVGDPLGEPLWNAYLSNLLLVASSGNDGEEQLNYPAGWHMVMAIGASDRNDNRRASSNYGSHIDVVAPGEDI